MIALFDEVLGPKHPFSWQGRGNRAEQIVLQGRPEEAERIQREVAAKLAEINGPDSGEAVEASTRLGETLRKRGRAAEAVALHRRALEVYTRQLGESNPTVAMARYQLAADLIAMGQAADRAEERRLLDAALAVLGKRVPPHPRLAEVRAASERLKS